MLAADNKDGKLSSGEFARGLHKPRLRKNIGSTPLG
jgi:hypothetical protein